MEWWEESWEWTPTASGQVPEGQLGQVMVKQVGGLVGRPGAGPKEPGLRI